MSDGLPKPCPGDPARKVKVPFKSWSAADSPLCATTVVPSSSTRRMGRLATERSVHFQSSSSTGLRSGTNWMASNSVVSVTFTISFAPARTPIFSRSEGRNEGALTLTLYVPGSKLATE